MAQTISYAQGSVSLYANGSAGFTTLFTNSSSYKTRAILTGLYFVGDYASPNSFYYTTFHNDGATGQVAILGNVRRNAYGGAWSFCPNADQTGVTGGQSTAQPSGVGVYASYQTTCNVTPTSIGVQATDGTYVTFNPSTIYMGPSDSYTIKMYWLGSSGFVTATIYYSFILIQET